MNTRLPPPPMENTTEAELTMPSGRNVAERGRHPGGRAPPPRAQSKGSRGEQTGYVTGRADTKAPGGSGDAAAADPRLPAYRKSSAVNMPLARRKMESLEAS
ncbi:UNVERIFIED_CONTAM: hypothetical protein K2H54_077470 [Gekko kuhli]